MNPIILNNYLQQYKTILNQIQLEVQKITTINKDLTERENKILSIQKDISEIRYQFRLFQSTQIAKSNLSSTITKLYSLFHIENKQPISTMLYLDDNRIITGGEDGSLAISTIDFRSKQWNILTHYTKAHDHYINAITKIDTTRLISASDDTKIKIWFINKDNTFTLLKTLTNHTREVRKVLYISNNRFISSAFDNKVIVWKIENNNYIKTKVIEEELGPSTMLQLKDKEIVLYPGKINDEKVLMFWDFKTYKKLHHMNGVFSGSMNGLMQLPNGLVVSADGGRAIYVIDPETYTLLKTITNSQFIVYDHKICSVSLLDGDSFIYVHGNCLCQISVYDYDMLFKVKQQGEFIGMALLTVKGRYIIANNDHKGLTVYETLTKR
jgi:WD40 repeat protein